MPARLVVVRHGQTAWSRAGRHTGTTDLSLDDDGRAAALALRGRLAGHRFGLVLVSPLRRAAETCELAGFADTATIARDLREWDYGAYEGRTTDEIRRERPGWSLWLDGVPGGETLAQVATRADRVVARVTEHGGDALAFAHGHLLRVLAARWLGEDPGLGAHLVLGPAALGVLGHERDTPALERWNDTGPGPLP